MQIITALLKIFTVVEVQQFLRQINHCGGTIYDSPLRPEKNINHMLQVYVQDPPTTIHVSMNVSECYALLYNLIFSSPWC